ncbi:MAG: SH3 domain-containing protein [Hyphomicrobiales bacterium]|nr:SH3 domain-containing protein [Hyphomicrobiales bacterium]
MNLGFGSAQMSNHARLANIGRHLLVVAGLAVTGIAHADSQPTIGSASGLPLPRYVTLKSDKVNLRQGPSRNHQILFVYQRRGLPVEITAEDEIWYRIRDSSGTEGWVLHSLLSGDRGVLVAPDDKGGVFNLHSEASAHSTLVARLQSDVIARVKSCDGTWCHIMGTGYSGYMRETRLWGVFPKEKFP